MANQWRDSGVGGAKYFTANLCPFFSLCVLIHPAAKLAYMRHFCLENVCRKTLETKSQRDRMEGIESTNRWQAVLLRLGWRRLMPETLEAAETGGALQGTEAKKKKNLPSHSCCRLQCTSHPSAPEKPEDAAKTSFCFSKNHHFSYLLCLPSTLLFFINLKVIIIPPTPL